ncbi:bifunctional 4-hydroxy-2-oxoglutarate aldolase/2-dehydro-3-deoxy-phosphogluconate aldolase [Spirosoma sp. 209]|uniref:bifunctional 4-hydroxy-2-oxoglutarate aldolase/2-dehydro-3-deoxy-phosphogluconate aldolase n=1 Tax=Spirosoma sp. 209 TaxID=1955701 RepID=UPI00098D15C3|nr:bifunctional 4-hydroxy-2-oxoglutarate aldolase/2-dehydro-3-deoxy-phosphogluconate aldolase [Spirosoma sp. 209]
MARFTPEAITTKLATVPIVPLFTHADVPTARSVVRACYAGGVRVFEYTNRSDQAELVFADLVRLVRQEMPDLALGIGTIFTADEARKYIDLDADFIIQPIIRKEVADVCHQAGAAWLPGALTPTEIAQADHWGASVVKVFPASVVGPAFIQALRGPMPTVKLMATGGVEPTHANLRSWFSVGAFCVGMGSQLFPASVLAAREYGQIQALVANCVAVTKKIVN